MLLSTTPPSPRTVLATLDIRSKTRKVTAEMANMCLVSFMLRRSNENTCAGYFAHPFAKEHG